MFGAGGEVPQNLGQQKGLSTAHRATDAGDVERTRRCSLRVAGALGHSKTPSCPNSGTSMSDMTGQVRPQPSRSGSKGGCCACGKERAHTSIQLELRGLHLVTVTARTGCVRQQLQILCVSCLAGQALSAFFTTFETAHNACTAGGPALHAQPKVTLTTCGGSLGNGPEQGHPLPTSDRRESSHFTRPARRHYMYKNLGLPRSRSA